jgi:hypothetical protein
MHGPTSMNSSISASSIPPTIPFHVAQAYGTSAAAQISRVAAGAGNIPPTSQVQAAATGPAAKLPSAAQKLVGATVAGRVDFSGDKPAQVTGGAAFALYTRPADKNAAATAVSIGRSLDVRG